MTNKAIFWDRDGVINALVNGCSPRFKDDIYVNRAPKRLMKIARDKGYLNFVITNQPDYALGKIESLAQTMYIHEEIMSHLDGLVDDFAICIHHPKSIHEYLRECNCKKPKAGNFISLINKYDVDSSQSINIGDREVDIEAGMTADIGVNIRLDLNGGESRADIVIQSTKELIPIFEEL